MDVPALTEFLAFLLPYLRKDTAAAADEATDRFGVATWEYAGKLWRPLSGPIEAHPPARTAASDLVQHPDDQAARDAFAGQLEKLLAADPGLRAEVGQLWEQARAAGATVRIVIASAERAGAFDDIRNTPGTASQVVRAPAAMLAALRG
jgi:hypothetical protein